VINEESSGTIQLLKKEIQRLKQEMAEMSRHTDLRPQMIFASNSASGDAS